MSNSKRSSDEEQRRQPQEAASHGDNSKSVTPKDVSPQDASAKDVTERKMSSDNPEEKEQEMLDDAVDLTFPASDPIAVPSIDKERERRIAEQHRHR